MGSARHAEGMIPNQVARSKDQRQSRNDHGPQKRACQSTIEDAPPKRRAIFSRVCTQFLAVKSLVCNRKRLLPDSWGIQETHRKAPHAEAHRVLNGQLRLCYVPIRLAMHPLCACLVAMRRGVDGRLWAIADVRSGDPETSALPPTSDVIGKGAGSPETTLSGSASLVSQ